MNINKWKDIFINYIRNNLKEYLLVSLIFIIGLFIGVLIVNNSNEQQITEINMYLTDFVTKFKEVESIDKLELTLQSVRNNIILTTILWIAGTTVIGLPIVLIAILFRGLCLGYTISAIAFTLGKIKGLLFCFLAMILHNILFIPAVLTIGVSSIKLYKSITKNREKENIKVEIIRHSIISGIMFLLLIASSVLQNFITVPILKSFIKYF